MRISAVILILLSGFACTSSAKPGVKSPVSDTASVFKAVFDEDFLNRNMPGYGAPGIGQKGIMGDTILLEQNDSLDNFIPARFSAHILKRVTRDSICMLVNQLKNDSVTALNFLRVKDFQKTGSGYTIILQATCVMPDPATGKAPGARPCIFGMVCGGGIRINAIRRKDGFTLTPEGSWSD